MSFWWNQLYILKRNDYIENKIKLKIKIIKKIEIPRTELKICKNLYVLHN